jgi:microcystin-dependent protein
MIGFALQVWEVSFRILIHVFPEGAKMMIKKKQRQELYDKFRQGGTPSGADFADLIKSQLNLLDDGIDISEDPDDPVCLKAHGSAENILDFANQDGIKRWRISGCSEAASTEGLNIQADERSKVYIERETGNVGINTDEPAAKLHIIQTGADDALRIDDMGSDETPFVITSDGQVGIGTGIGDERPKAKLHISYDGAGDILRVDDRGEDSTPLVINEQGNVGIGCSSPNANLTIVGGVSICSQDSLARIESKPTGNSLYVEGDITVGGTVVFSGGQGAGGIQFNAPLTSNSEELVIKDNLKISGDTAQEGSKGDLTVAGNTFLGTFNAVKENQNVVVINGRIRSGGLTGQPQYELDVNETLTVNRNPSARKATVNGDLDVQADLNTQGDLNINGNIHANGDLDTKKKVKENGNALIPKGIIAMWSGTASTIPGGWALCDGSNGTPDLRSRFIVGAGQGTNLSDYPTGHKGGQESVQLTVSQMPAHNHNGTLTTTEAGGHTHQYWDERFPESTTDADNGKSSDPMRHNRPNLDIEETTSRSGNHSHNVTIPSNGSDQSHENRPPFYALAFIMKQ